MTLTDTKQVANFSGLLRCSNDGQTVFAAIGETLKPCSCGNGIWLFFLEDNILKRLSPIYLNAFEAIEAEQVPAIGQGLNLSGGINRHQGAYMVTRVYRQSGALGQWPAIEVESVGPWDSELFAYPVRTIAS